MENIQTDVFIEESKTRFVLLSGSNSDLSLLDFSSVGLKCISITSKRFDIFFKNSAFEKNWYERNKKFLFDEIRNEGVDLETVYVLMPLILNENIDNNTYYKCWQVLIIMFPSVLTYYGIFDYQVFDNKYIWQITSTVFPFRERHKQNEYLYFEKSRISSINKFINMYFERVDKIKYLKPAIESYNLSFYANLYSMSYLSLCICLETIVAGSNEITYKIRRNVAVLCSNDLETGLIIFKNVGNLYALRSKIVHEGVMDSEKIAEYRPYLKSLISKLIVELVTHNILTVEELNEKITSVGFGYRKQLSTNYRSLLLNKQAESMLKVQILSKFK